MSENSNQLADTGRFFPAVSDSLYKTLGGGSDGAGRAELLLREVDRPAGFLTRHGWRAPGPRDSFASLLRLHRDAMAAESSGRHGRADFFWEELRLRFGNAAADGDMWRDVAEAAAGPSATLKSEEIRRRFVREILIDTHLAYYSAYLEAKPPAPGNRAFFHSRFIREYARAVGEDWAAEIVASVALREAAVCTESGDLRRPVDLLKAAAMQARSTDILQDELAIAYVKAAEAYMGEAENKPQRSARWLGELAADASSSAFLHSGSAELFCAASRLNCMHSLLLNNIGDLSGAILAAEKAVHYDPAFEDAERVRGELNDRMVDLIAKFNQLSAEHSNLGQVLTSEGKVLLRQARTGFQPAVEFRSGTDAEAILLGYRRARQYSLWRHAGKPIPTGRDVDDAVEVFAEGLAIVAGEDPSSREDIYRAWKKATEKLPPLATVDSGPVLAFLRQRLIGEDVDEGGDRVNEPGLAEPEPSGRLSIPTGKISVRGGEPALTWIASGQNLLAKVAFVTAALAVMFASAIVLRERRSAAIRDQAFRTMSAAKRIGEPEKSLDGAESFLANLSWLRNDAREPAVRDIYDEAIVQFFARNGGGEAANPAEGDRLARYKALTGK